MNSIASYILVIYGIKVAFEGEQIEGLCRNNIMKPRSQAAGELLPAHIAHSRKRHARTNAEPPPRSHPLAHPQVMLILLQSEVSFHPPDPGEAFFPLVAGQRGKWGARGDNGGREGGSKQEGREDLSPPVQLPLPGLLCHRI